MSAFERKPKWYRDLCEQAAGKGRSPQNRYVIAHVDRYVALHPEVKRDE